MSVRCPNPWHGGCGCPRSSSRCYGAIREVREMFQANLAQPGPDQGDRMLAAYNTLDDLQREMGSHKGWTVGEILRRF